MRSFLQFLLSEKLDDFKPSELGFSNQMTDLPDKAPYGFWMDRHGNFIKVGYQQHEDMGAKILYKAGEPIVEGIYSMLLKRGWARIVTSEIYGELSYEVVPGGELNNIQKKNIEFMAMFYGYDRIVKD